MSYLAKTITLLILIIFSLTTTGTRINAKIDYPFLRDIICDEVETPGEKNPDFAVGKIVNQTGGLPWGRCQIKYWTAVRAGFSTERNPGDLFKESISREFSLKVLKMYGRDLVRRGIPETVRTVSHYYGSGYRRRYPKSAYSRTVVALYNQRMFERRAKERTQVIEFSQTNYTLATYTAYGSFGSAKTPRTFLGVLIKEIRLFFINHSVRSNNFL